MSPTRACAAVAALVFVSQLGPSVVAQSGLEGPDDTLDERAPFGRTAFHTDLGRENFGRPLPDPPALRSIPPVREILGVSYYVDGEHSIADPVLKRRNEAAVRPLHAYLAEVAALADGWNESRPANPAYATRVIEALDAWAREDALLGTVNKQGAYERVWALSGLALAYLRVREAPSVDHGAEARIETWFDRVGRAIRDELPTRGPVSRLNNHACWAALALAAAAIAAHDQSLYQSSLDEGRAALGQVRADGFLPLELQRRALALHYHLFALAPLVMLGELVRANGGGHARFRLGEKAESELASLTNRVSDGLREPGTFAKAAGAPQSIALPPRGADLAWAEIVYARTLNPQLGAWIAAARPLRDDRLGGSMTLAFGVPELKK
jgi:poly(beta-D-mannuronate) lyase